MKAKQIKQFYSAFTPFYICSEMGKADRIKTCWEDVITVNHAWVSPEIRGLEGTVVLETVLTFPQEWLRLKEAISEMYQKFK